MVIQISVMSVCVSAWPVYKNARQIRSEYYIVDILVSPDFKPN